MNCKELEPRLTAYLAGELDEVSARAARGHLRVCEACRVLAEDHARVQGALASLGADRPEPPSAMWDAIQARLGEAEIADSRQPRWARWWLRVRPHLAPAGLALGACAAAAILIHARRGGDDDARPDGVRAAVVARLHDERADRATPDRDVVDHGAPVARPRPDRDASVELADEAKRIEEQFRDTVAELLPAARAEVATWRPAQARAFKVELAKREGATVRAAPGRDRDRAWHALIAFLETTALGERVAVAR